MHVHNLGEWTGCFMNSDKENSDVVISVVMTIYNHGNFLARALDSVLSQETSLKYEIVIGDDASTDNSAALILRYSDKYPDKIVAVLRKNNIGGSRNFTDLFRRCRGRYITFIEGDDYWIDSKKLQLQYDYLENDTNSFSVSHRIKVCDSNDDLIRYVPNVEFHQSRHMLMSDFLIGKRFALTATMMRSPSSLELEGFLYNIDIGARNEGDTTICLYLLDKSPIPILDEAMSVYQYRSIDGHANYNSITKLSEKIQDKINLISLNDRVYAGKYYLGWMYARLAATALRGFIKCDWSELSKLLVLLLKITMLFFKTSFNYALYSG